MRIGVVGISESITPPVFFNEFHQETIEWETEWDYRMRKEVFFSYMTASAYHVIWKEVENHIFRHNWIFRHTCIYKQPTLRKQWNYNMLSKYYTVILDTLVGSFLNVLFLLFAKILSGLHEKTRRKYLVTAKGT